MSDINIRKVHTLVLGSGAAGLNAAVQLRRRGIDEVLLLSEGLQAGTSINTGSDKQTYYKLGLYGNGADAPRTMAETFFSGGSMDGDIALIEASLSARGFYNLLELGVSFPQDRFGQFPGYKTDHDPHQRATSIGPYTSREMCRALIREVERMHIPVLERRVAVKLLTVPERQPPEDRKRQRIAGVFCVDLSDPDKPAEQAVEFCLCENLVFATGGPGGLYRDSVYPNVHTGGIGLALEIGAKAQNLSESQFGLASTAFRWNVSGTYMQAIPRFVSTASDGRSDEREFLVEEFPNKNTMFAAVFLKGYQWPFDVRKIEGSSLIDLLVYRETVERGRRVFLDFRTNTAGLDLAMLPDEVRDYLRRSEADFGTPIERLTRMNPIAIELYKNNGIDLHREPLEIALCAQHNNGGLAVNAWWESVNIAHLFAAGEVAGTHGVARPGGSALNAGQVAGFRIAEYIAARYAGQTLDSEETLQSAGTVRTEITGMGLVDWREERRALQARMSDCAGPIVSLSRLDEAWNDSCTQFESIGEERVDARDAFHLAESLRTRSLCLAHLLYLAAVRDNVPRTGSRGSRLVLDDNGSVKHPSLGWNYMPENIRKRETVLETYLPKDRSCLSDFLVHEERPRRPLPECDAWFETAWADYRAGGIFDTM